MESVSSILSKTGITLFLRILGILSGYLFMFVISRDFGPRVWGDFSIFLVVLQIMVSIAKLGLDVAFLKIASETWITKKYDSLSQMYSTSLFLVGIFSVFVAIVTWLISTPLANYVFHKSQLELYFYVASLLTPLFSLLSLHSEALRAVKKYILHMLTQQTGLFIASLFIFLIFLFLNFPFEEYTPVVSYAFAVFFCFIFALFFWLHIFLRKTYFSFSIDRRIVAYLISLSFPLFVSGIASMLMAWTDIIMLGIFRSSSDVGIYSVAMKISTLVSISLVAVNTVIAPRIAELWALGRVKELADFVKDVTRVVSIVSFLIFSFVVFTGKVLLTTFGYDYALGYYPLIILSFGQLINAFSGSVGYILMMTDFQHFHRNVTLLGIVLNVALNWLLIPMLGILGAALATMVTLVFWNIIFSWKVRQILGRWIFGL